MELSETLLLAGIAIIFLIGIAGVIVPIIPSLPIIWGGIILYGVVNGFDSSLQQIILWTGVLTLIGTLLDTLMSVIGARIYGASTFGMIGAFLGGIVGFVILNLPGLILGSFIGTFICEYFRESDRERSLRAAWGTIIGFICGTAVKLILAITMIILFLRHIL